MAGRLAVLILLGCIAGTCNASRPCSHSSPKETEVADSVQALLQLLPSASSSAMHHDEDCVATCNGDEVEYAEKMECWGTHLFKCKGNTSFSLSKCEGHHLGFHVPERSMYVGVCEGLEHKFAHWESTCPKTGATSVRFFGKGCLGTGSIVKQQSPTPDALAPSVAVLLAQASAAPADPALQHLVDALPQSPLQLTDDAYGGSFESRCNGRGGVLFAVKWGKQEQQASMELAGDVNEQFTKLKELVEAAVGDAPPELQFVDGDMPAQDAAAPHHPPPPPKDGDNIMSLMVHLATHSGPTPGAPAQLGDGLVKHEHPTCTLTCNGRPPWFGGRWPCWGDLSVNCTTGDTPPGAKTMSFSASCKGLWTGALGHMCWGLTLQHTTKSWPSGNADMWGICSGKQGVWGHHDQDSVAMGQWCHGGSVAHGVVATHPTDIPATAYATV